MFQFPFGNLQQLNLDWFLGKFNEYVDAWYTFKDSVEGSITDIFNARDAAVNAKNDAVSAKNDAVIAKTAADADALKSEGFALGEQNGTPVASGSPYYENNAKYYSIESGTYRFLSEAYARGEMDGVPVSSGDAGFEDNAKYYKDLAHTDYTYVHDHVTDADASALEAEGYAVGEQGGTPVASGSPYYENNAKYYAGETLQDKLDTDTLKDAANSAALRSEGFAVGEQNGTPVTSGSPYYQNNAEYYMQETLTALVSVTEAIQIAGFVKNAFPTALAPLSKYQAVSTAGLTATGNTIVTITGGTGAWNQLAIVGIKIPINTTVNILVLPLKNQVSGTGRIGYIAPVIDNVAQNANRYDIQASSAAGYISIASDSNERNLDVQINGLNTPTTGSFECQIIVEQSTGATRSLGLVQNPIDIKEIEDDNVKSVE